MKRCTLVVPDAGPFNSLWVADELGLLLALDMPIIVIDAVYDELTGDQRHLKDRDVHAFIAGHRPPFLSVTTELWQWERARRARGERPKRNAGELAIADFLSSEDGLRTLIRIGDPVLLLYEDRDIRIINRPPNVHLLSTVGLLHGLQRSGLIASAERIIDRMTHPVAPGRRPVDRRVFTDLPDGTDEPAKIGSVWIP